ncbi:hypothetical protein J6590_026653 [Homalodisca vitripennis]|nr:hypothetical protein J6590_026653 [Homalodisca vitripennis]
MAADTLQTPAHVRRHGHSGGKVGREENNWKINHLFQALGWVIGAELNIRIDEPAKGHDSTLYAWFFPKRGEAKQKRRRPKKVMRPARKVRHVAESEVPSLLIIAFNINNIAGVRIVGVAHCMTHRWMFPSVSVSSWDKVDDDL